MAVSLQENKCLLLAIFSVVVYFLWMDVALYYHVQALQPKKPGISSTGTDNGMFNPFNPITVKLLMMDPPNHYINMPLSAFINKVTYFTEVFYFITPNVISISHVFIALFAVKFIMSESLCMRQIGALLFEFRTFLDAFDGVIARSLKHIQVVTTDVNSIGYIVDGVCDGLGCIALFIACFIYLRRHPPRKGPYTQLPVIWTKGNSESRDEKDGLSPGALKGHVTTKKILAVVFCFAAQMLISSVFWNRYISGYHDILEVTNVSEQQMVLQNQTLRSSTMWIIVWFWRIINAHALTEMIIISIFFDKLWEFLFWIQYIGFIPLIILISSTEVHMHNVHGYIFSSIPENSSS